ncbi:MAG TPA: CPBP family intramembrane glutamic endopeptidase [Terriglobia bacterium]|nr:CPBP family intramembrane glutamic endopeptidase [Terriglobia bacterium]
MNGHRVFLCGGHVRPVWRFFISAVMVLCANLAVGIVLGLTSGVFGWEPQSILFWESSLNLLALLALFKLLTTVFENKPLASMGFAFRGRWKTELAIGLSLGAAIILALAVLEWVLGFARFSPNPISVPQLLAGGVYYCAIFAMAAAGEEITFRGYPFQRLVESVGPPWAVTILSVAFGLVHWGNPSHTWLSTLNTMLIGIPLAVAYLRTRALWLPLGIHFAWNFILGYGLGLPVSGLQFSHTLMRADVRGLVQITGGSYGPEGGWLATIVIVALTLYVSFTPGIYLTPEMRALAFDAPYPAPGNPHQAPELFKDSTDKIKMMLPGVK